MNKFKFKFNFMSLATVMVITLQGCMNSPVSDPNRVKSSPELTPDATTAPAEITIQATIANTRTDIPTNKIGTQEGDTTPKFTLLMSNGDTRIFPASLETDKPIFLLFFTPH